MSRRECGLTFGPLGVLPPSPRLPRGLMSLVLGPRPPDPVGFFRSYPHPPSPVDGCGCGQQVNGSVPRLGGGWRASQRRSHG